MFDMIDIDELDTTVGECDVHGYVATRECKNCTLDTCAVCVVCEFCG
jgi:hypothetical protein